MDTSTKVLYAIWFLFPLFFLLMAIWGKLEKLSGQKNRDDIKDYMRQGIFVLVAVALSIAIDMYALESIATVVLFDMVPLLLLRIVLLPIVLFLMALVVGPSKEIKVSKAPNLGKHYERRGKR